MKAQKISMMTTPYNDLIFEVYEATISGVSYSVGVDTYRKSLLIETNDPNFKIDNKSLIGRRLGSFKNKADVTLIPGWGYYLKLDEYWYAAFCWKEGEDINDDSKVLFVFQYEFPKQ